MAKKNVGLPDVGPECGNRSFVFWESAGANQMYYRIFFNQIMSMALSRFEWLNLPPTCNERYLEMQLLYNGVASIAKPKNRKNIYTLQAILDGRPNMYETPSKWGAMGVNGTHYSCNWRCGALVYNTWGREPLIPGIQMYAYELSDLMAVKRVNRMHQKTPYIFKGPASKQNQMANIFKQVSGNEPAIIADSDIDKILSIDVVDTHVDYIADKVDADIENTWRKVYGFLGVNDLPYKAERQITQEVADHSEPSVLNRLAPLVARREAADHVNRLFGTQIKVQWRRDWRGEFNDRMVYGGTDDDTGV